MKRGLFFKYVVLFVGLVTVVLVVNAALDLYFAFQDNRRASIDVQREKAESASQKIESFVREIEHQIGWVAYPQWAALPVDQRRFEYVRLLRQVPAITELTQLDRDGHEQLKVSRLSMDVVGSNIDRSSDPAFTEAVANKIYFGPVYYRKESEPYLSMAVAHGGRTGGVTVAEINLKLILDVITQIKVGREGYAYVVDTLGRLVAHPDISLVLRGTDMNRLPQVAGARASNAPAEQVEQTRDLVGRSVLSAHAEIPALKWLVFVELPSTEVLKPVIDTGLRDLALLVLGLLIAGGAAAFLARRMVVPIRVLQSGAERIGGGDLGHRLSVKTGDELEALADQFNLTASALQESYETLEQRVEDRTSELRDTLEQQTATSEILHVISQSPTDVQPVLNVVVTAARRFCGAEDAVIMLRDGTEMVLSAHDGPLDVSYAIRQPIGLDTTIGRAMVDGQTIHIPDIKAVAPLQFGEHQTHVPDFDFHAVVAAPMVREGYAIGAVVLRKAAPGGFTPRQLELLETFAAQAVIAIENVRLFTEIQEKSRQLEIASQHKSQFLANMSHELRTPLNAILGYTEMMVDGLYGAMPEKAATVLDRVQSNGKHLLGLINDVLDLAKIEAGQLVITIEPYVVGDMVATVLSATESLARTKGIELGSDVAPGLPHGSGDARRLTQVLLNLVGNAIKFTDKGSVEVRAVQVDDTFELSVVDTGFGIAPEDQKKIFEEFQQVDNSSTRKKGGTGLGLSISRKIVELHGGAITVASEIGKGSTFKVTIPVHVAAAKEGNR